VGKVVSCVAPAVAVAALVACGGDEDAAGPSRPAPATATATTAATPSPLDVDHAELRSGRPYATRAFRPGLTFRPGPGTWTIEHRDTASDISIATDLPRVAVATIGWHRVTRVYDPVRGGVAPSDQVALREPFADWLARHPRLRVTRPVRVTVAGLDGVQVDVRSTSQPPRVPRDCLKAGPRCVPLFYDGQDPLTYTRGDRGRVTVLPLPDADGGGELVIEQFASPGTALPKVLAATRETLATLEVAR
jgi:hypothetical protein